MAFTDVPTGYMFTKGKQSSSSVIACDRSHHHPSRARGLRRHLRPLVGGDRMHRSRDRRLGPRPSRSQECPSITPMFVLVCSIGRTIGLLERRRRGALWRHRRPTLVRARDDHRGFRIAARGPERPDLEHDQAGRTDEQKAEAGTALRPSGPAGRCRCHDDLIPWRHRSVVHDGGRCAARTGLAEEAAWKTRADQRPRTDLNVTTRGAAGTFSAFTLP